MDKRYSFETLEFCFVTAW